MARPYTTLRVLGWPSALTTTIIAALAAIAFAAFGVQTVTGFGSMLVAVTLGAHLVDIPTLLMLFLPLSLIQCGYVGVRYRAGIDWRLLLAMIFSR